MRPLDKIQVEMLPAAKTRLSREEAALREIGRTDFAPGTARFLVIAFLLTILSVPLIQQIHEVKQYYAGQRSRALPRAYEILESIPKAARAFFHTRSSLLDRTLAITDSLHQDIKRYEDALKEDSAVGKAILPVTQIVLVGLGVGNEKAYVGRDHWLFYRPDIDYLTGRGFLETRQLAKRFHSGDRWTPAPQPDPLRAIIQFRNQLAERGIDLIVMPVPTKSMIHPEKFSSAGTERQAPLQNPSYDRFKSELAEQRVLLFDPTDALLAAKSGGGQPQFLETDTHWTPEAVGWVADRLKRFIEEHVKLPALTSPGFKQEAATVTNLGDIAVMLQLPPDQTIFPKQSVDLHQVLSRQNELWRGERSADVLVLGDSFANIYSLTAMGWGESAGLVEQASFRLQRPIDCFLRNDDAAFATRQLISRELAQGKDRLAGKKLVIWQFAMRELAFGDWKLLDLKLGQPSPRRFVVPASGEEMIVSGQVESVSAVPKPRSVPYKDHILSLHLTDLAVGKVMTNTEAIVYSWSMRDNVWTSAASLRPGQKVKLKLKPWSDVSDKLERINRSELSDEKLQLEEPSWGEVLEK